MTRLSQYQQPITLLHVSWLGSASISSQSHYCMSHD